MSTTEVELAEEIEQISQVGYLVGWWQAAELIEQAHQRFEQGLVDDGEPLSVFQLARLRLPDLQARFLATKPDHVGGYEAGITQLRAMSRDQLVAAILGARS